LGKFSLKIRVRSLNLFVQVDNSSTREFPGAGLGLAITKKLCEKLGGGISVESEEGKG